VHRASDAQIDALMCAIRDGKARRHNGGELPARVEGGFVSRGGRWFYPDVEGIPSFLVDDRIELTDPV
jgi:hypothetical protein